MYPIKSFLAHAYQFECSQPTKVAAALVIGCNADEKQASIIMEARTGRVEAKWAAWLLQRDR